MSFYQACYKVQLIPHAHLKRFFLLNVFLFLFAFFQSTSFAFTEVNYIDRNDYPETVIVNDFFGIKKNNYTVPQGAKVKLRILVPAGINQVKMVPSSNSFQYGVRLGSSPDALKGSNGDVIMFYNSYDQSDEHYVHIYIDNSNASRSFVLSKHSTLMLYILDDSTKYDNWMNPPQVTEESLKLDSTSSNSENTVNIYAAGDLFHQVGRAESDGWSANTVADTAGYLSYGPYIDTLTPGQHSAVFSLMIDNNSADNSVVVSIDVYNYMTGTVLAKRDITRQEFKSPLTYQGFNLNYILPQTSSKNVIEYRVVWHGTSYLKMQNVIDILRCSITTN